MPKENLSDAELRGKSTSDRTKRRVAHEVWFPLPAIARPAVVPVKVLDQPKPKKNVLKKEDVCTYKLPIINNNISNVKQ